MKKSIIFTSIILILVVAGLLFYWSEYRPYKASIACINMAPQDTIKNNPVFYSIQELLSQGKEGEAQAILNRMSEIEYSAYKEKKAKFINGDQADMKYSFWKCMREKGIKE